jgi:hypothetical protein
MAFPVLLPRAPPRAPALSARCPQTPADPPGAPFDEADAVRGTGGWMRVPFSDPTSDPFSDPFRSTLKNGHPDPANVQVRRESRAAWRPDLIYSIRLFRSTRPSRPGTSASRLIVVSPVRVLAFPGPLARVCVR